MKLVEDNVEQKKEWVLTVTEAHMMYVTLNSLYNVILTELRTPVLVTTDTIRDRGAATVAAALTLA